MILIPIPVIKYSATARKGVVKRVCCYSCRHEYAYHAIATGTGRSSSFILPSEFARSKAAAKARNSLANELANVSAPVPCPKCGEYQPDMTAPVPQPSRFAFRLLSSLAFVLTAIVALFGYATGQLGYATGQPFSPSVIAVLLAVFGALAIVTFLMPQQPAATAEERKALGRRYALYGGQVSQLEKTLAPAKTDFFVDQEGRARNQLP